MQKTTDTERLPVFPGKLCRKHLVVSMDQQQDKFELSGESHEPRDPLKLFLKRADQVTVASLLIICALVFVVYIAVEYRSRDGLVHFDRAGSKTIEHQIDINSADWPEIADLPGIGESLARAIIDHREKHGPFRTIDSLLSVNGIGQKKLQRIKQYLPHTADGSLLVGQ